MSKHATLGGSPTIAHDSVPVQLVRLANRVPAPTSTGRPRCGRPNIYPDGLFLKALVIMTLRRLHRVSHLLAVLEEPTEEMRALRELLLSTMKCWWE